MATLILNGKSAQLPAVRQAAQACREAGAELGVLILRDFASLGDMARMRRELPRRPGEGTFVETFRTA